MDGLSKTKHLVLGAIIAALCSFVYAKVPGVSHGGAYAHAAGDHAMRGDPHSGPRYYSVADVGVPRNNTTNGNSGARRGGANFAAGDYVNGFGRYNAGVRRVAGPAGYPGDGRGGMQYAGAITPVSAESRAVPRPPANAPVRSGSIRADVARYNEERGSTRAMQRQGDDPRQPEGSPYRN
ncbi:hypothetical protein [Paraburkholderia fungorum]|uniref:hypothetical protein n=1 Tax=Paraburkholderia fungorum TaxID=134537 RepID=UPI0038BC6A7D